VRTGALRLRSGCARGPARGHGRLARRAAGAEAWYEEFGGGSAAGPKRAARIADGREDRILVLEARILCPGLWERLTPGIASWQTWRR
jgi:hypothetical protein